MLDPIAEYHVEIHHWMETTAATDRTYDTFKQTVIARGKQLARHAARNPRTARQHQQLPPEVPSILVTTMGLSEPTDARYQGKRPTCRFWQTAGRCRYGAKCRFRHESDGASRYTKRVKEDTKRCPEKIDGIPTCRRYARDDRCRYGSKCKFMHYDASTGKIDTKPPPNERNRVKAKVEAKEPAVRNDPLRLKQKIASRKRPEEHSVKSCNS